MPAPVFTLPSHTLIRLRRNKIWEQHFQTDQDESDPAGNAGDVLRSHLLLHLGEGGEEHGLLRFDFGGNRDAAIRTKICCQVCSSDV